MEWLITRSILEPLAVAGTAPMVPIQDAAGVLLPLIPLGKVSSTILAKWQNFFGVNIMEVYQLGAGEQFTNIYSVA